MHILLLTTYFPPENGSASHLFYELGRAFIGRGYRVSVVTGFPSYHVQTRDARYEGRWWMREMMNGIEVYRTAVPQLLRDTPIGRGLWQFSAAAALGIAALRIPRPDVALVYSPPLPLGLSAQLLRLVKRVPFVFNVQDLFPQSAIDLGILRQPQLISLFRRLERAIYKRCDAITAHSAGTARYVIENGAAAGTTQPLHNWVDLDHIATGFGQGDVLRAELGLQDKFIVSFAGVMGYSQDLDVILQAAARVRQAPSVHFLLVGDGVRKEAGMQQAAKLGLTNVTWLPMQSRDKYPHILDASDVSLATLKAEVTTSVVPSKILSIMAAGKPVIAGLDLNGDVPELIDSAEAGIYMQPEDPRLLADAIMQMVQNPACAKQLGANGRRYMEAHFSLDGVVDRYEQIFESLM